MAFLPFNMSLATDKFTIHDLRGATENSNTNADLARSITAAISCKSVPFDNHLIRSIPTLVLYDDRGLELFDEITYLDDYYLTNAEIDIFERFGEHIARDRIPDGAVLIELGCG